MTDWEVFKQQALPDLWRPLLPVIEVVENDHWLGEGGKFPEALGYFDGMAKPTRIVVLPAASWWTIAHEYGHWAVWRLGEWLDALWEVPWWALRLRRLVGRKRAP